jgi:hypothetical protein
MGSKYGEKQLALYRLAGEYQVATNLVSGVRNRTVQVYVLSGSKYEERLHYWRSQLG